MGQRQRFDVLKRETTVLVSLTLELTAAREFLGQKSSLELFFLKKNLQKLYSLIRWQFATAFISRLFQKQTVATIFF